MDAISVLLVDDSPIFTRAVTYLLQGYDNIHVVGIAENGRDGLELCHSLRPHIVLMDLAMPGLSGLQVIPRLRTRFPGTGIIILTLKDSDHYRRATLQAGADDFISKSELNACLVPAIERIAGQHNIRN